MKGKKLYDAITNVEEKYIEEARDAKLKKESNKKIKWMAIAASFVLLLGISSIYLLQNMDGSSGGDGSPQGKSDTFMYYAGPVFPLTLDIEDDEITSSRNITYDFSFPQEDSLRVWGANVKDGYIFNNHSESEKTVKVIYPFVGTYDKLKEEMPRIDLNEQKTETTLYAGGYKGDLTGNKLLEDHNDSVKSIELRKWEDYRTLLQDGTYKRNAFSSYPDLSQKVTVYTFSDFKAPNEYDAATQAISFHIDPNKTTILHYGFNGAEFKEDGSRSYSYFVPREDQLYRNGKKVLVVIGEDIENYSLEGYKNGACEKGNELDGVSATITKSQQVLSDLLSELIDDFFHLYREDGLTSTSKEMFKGAVSEFIVENNLLSQSIEDSYQYATMEDIFSHINVDQRVFYLVFQIKIPPKDYVSITAQLQKEPSHDFTGSGSSKEKIQAYDMTIHLGSNLSFDTITADLTSTENIEIFDNNFGFDLSQGISKVEIDPNIEHYYLNIRPINKNDK